MKPFLAALWMGPKLGLTNSQQQSKIEVPELPSVLLEDDLEGLES